MALPWIPLGLATLLMARDPSRRVLATIGTALCWSLMVLCGDFQAALIWVPAALALALMYQQRRTLTLVLAASLLLAVILTAPQWMTTMFAMLDSHRAGGIPFEEATERSLHPVRLLELFCPYLFGTREQWFGHALAGAGAQKPLPWASSVHIGRIAIGLALLPLFRLKTPALKWAVIVAVGSLVLSFGRFIPLYDWWLSLPIVGSFRYPEKFILWSSLALSCLTAHGAGMLMTMLSRERFSRTVKQVVAIWPAILVVAMGIGSLSLLQLTSSTDSMMPWLLRQWLSLGVIVAALLLVFTKKARLNGAACWLALIVLIDTAIPWYMEKPTTSRTEPLNTPAVAGSIKKNAGAWGRVLADPALEAVPMDASLESLHASEARSVIRRATLSFNSPRLWGLRTAGGFSPLESDRLNSYRDETGILRDESVPQLESLLSYCRSAAVEWLFTTSSRAARLKELGQNWSVAESWGPENQTMLIKLDDVREAVCLEDRADDGVDAASQVTYDRRPRPGVIRVDLNPGDASTLRVSEAYAPGWIASDPLGNMLHVQASEHGFMEIDVPEKVAQVRMAYEPRGWKTGVALGGGGVVALLCLLALAAGRDRMRRIARAPLFMCVVGAIVFLVMGTAARSHWSCTFDEGFHVARGIARLKTGDARLSYYHPPLQNLVCAYFGNLAHGDRLNMPSGAAWDGADIWSYGSQFAATNSSVYAEFVRATRWGTAFFAVILIAGGVFLAGLLGGALAAWVCAFGLALNPNIPAHGNLTTTDMAVVALCVWATGLLLLFARTQRDRWLWLATTCFVLCAVLKHWGLMWLACYLLICIPLLAITKHRPRLMWQVPFGLLLLGLFLICLYGSAPQVIRAGEGHALTGKSFVAGRYIEGLIVQGKHSFTGHQAYFNGQRFMQGSWWHTLASIILKYPPVWLLALCCAGTWAVFRHRSLRGWIPWIPVFVYVLLLIFANRMVIGVRHALPVIVFGTVFAAAWCAQFVSMKLRAWVALLLVAASVWTALVTFPHYISYFPAWAGGVTNGHRWMVDSNYDWGQDLDVLEANWAALTSANGGKPPHLLYHGFLDPEFMYRMPLAQSSLKGFMGRTWKLSQGDDNYKAWIDSFDSIRGTTVGSISALQLDPFGIEMERFRAGRQPDRVANSFWLSLPYEATESTAEPSVVSQE